MPFFAGLMFIWRKIKTNYQNHAGISHAKELSAKSRQQKKDQSTLEMNEIIFIKREIKVLVKQLTRNS